MKRVLTLILALALINTAFAANGLTARYYEGSWSQLPDFFSLVPVKKATVKGVDLSFRNRDLNYAILWRGYLTVPAAGDYTFETASDDGSKLFIGEYSKTATPVVANDGLHPVISATGTLKLKAGVYAIAVSYLQAGGGQTMDVYWSSNTGISRTRLPENLLRTDSVAATTLAPEPVTGLNYSYYEGTWDNMPDFSLLTAVKKGNSKNIDLSARGRDLSYAFLWQGNLTIPVAGDYTFETLSDDGSKLWIGSYSPVATPLIGNDGLHPALSRSATIALKAGVYPITLAYFQAGGGQTMQLYWSSNSGISRSLLPDNALNGTITAPETTVVAAGATGGLKGINNYYFSSTSGDDSRTSLQAQDPATPWKTLAKLNQVMTTLKAGDAVLLKRGDVFEGTVAAALSGTQALPFIISAYGTGAKPLITGLATLSNWAARGNGVYESAVPASTPNVTLVTLNAQVQAMGRYPNITEANRGFLSVDAYSGTQSITDAALNQSINWTGAELVIRKVDWVLDRCLITGQSGATLSYQSPTQHEPAPGQGYFIQNSPYTLDQAGEWYYDKAARKLQVYLGATAPTSVTVKASCTATLVSISNKSYITLDNIALEGAGQQAISIDNHSTGIRVQNCSIDCSGTDALTAQDNLYLSVENNTITNSNNSGMRITYSSYTTIKGNTVRNSGVLPGMGQSGNQQMDGIYLESGTGSNNTIQGNAVYNSGYCGIAFTGAYTQIKNNLVDRFCTVVSDGGGIYTWSGWDKMGRVITGNIVLNGIGAFEGSSVTANNGAVGIYLDDVSSNVEVSNNSVAHCSRSGLYLHNAQHINVTGNTLFDNQAAYNTVFDGIGVNPLGNNYDFSIRDVSFQGNLLAAGQRGQTLMSHESRQADFSQQGSYDNNYYAKPLEAAKTGLITTSENNNTVYQDLDGWKEQYRSYDAHSVVSAVTVATSSGLQNVGQNMFTNSSFNANASGTDMSWDGGGHLDQGAAKVSGSGSGTMYAHLYFNGTVVAGRKYMIRMSMQGTTGTQNVRVFIQRNGPNWNNISGEQFMKLSTTRTENEFLFVPATTEPLYLMTLAYTAAAGPFYIDNVTMYEVTGEVAANPEASLRFEYNESATARTIALSEAALDLKGNLYTSQVTLAPYSSMVLVNKVQVQATAAAATKAAVTEAVTPAAAAPVAAAAQLAVSTDASGSRVYIRTAAQTKVTIFNALGAAMKTLEGQATLQADLTGWSSGVYIVSAAGANGKVQSQRFVKP